MRSVLAIFDEYDYDGIDLDWKYPNTEQGLEIRAIAEDLGALIVRIVTSRANSSDQRERVISPVR